MNKYVLDVHTPWFYKTYEVVCSDIGQASHKVKYLFIKEFGFIGQPVKIKLNKLDINNHINEILDKFI